MKKITFLILPLLVVLLASGCARKYEYRSGSNYVNQGKLIIPPGLTLKDREPKYPIVASAPKGDYAEIAREASTIPPGSRIAEYRGERKHSITGALSSILPQ